MIALSNNGSEPSVDFFRADLRRKLQGTPEFERGATPSLDGVSLVATARFPTRFGDFLLAGFQQDLPDGSVLEHSALIRGSVVGTTECAVRLHSECHTGDVLGSLRCDCRDQLEASLKHISRQPFGALIYLRQEGRGIGLLNKIKAYHLQDLGLDTIEANQYLGFPADRRDYLGGAAIISILGIKSVALLTNNLDKVSGLRDKGVTVVRRIPVVAPANPHNKTYLETKRRDMNHQF